MSLNILFIAGFHPDPDLGAPGTELRTIEKLRLAGHCVDEIWNADLWAAIKHSRSHLLFELPLAIHYSMWRRLKARKYHVVHVNQPHGWFAARSLRGRQNSPIFIHRSHGLEAHVRRASETWGVADGGLSRPLIKRSLGALLDKVARYHDQMIVEFADGHIVSSSADKAFIAEHYEVDLNRVAVVQQAAPDMFIAEPSIVTRDRNRANRILYVGQFLPIKGAFDVCRIAESVLRDRPNASFTWVTHANSHDTIRASFSEKSLLSRVQLLSWRPQSELMSIYDQHGIFLFPSLFEGFGKAFIEAMSRGLAVVGTNVGGMRDVVQHGVSGFISGAGEVRVMANHVRDLVDRPDLAWEMGMAARTRALEYSWTRTAAEIADFYGKCIEQKAHIDASGVRTISAT